MASPAPEKQTNPPSMVMLSGIRKSFTDVEVVKGVDLNIGVGEFFLCLVHQDVARQHCYA